MYSLAIRYKKKNIRCVWENGVTLIYRVYSSTKNFKLDKK